jgi:hypothetical protein
MGRKSCQIVLWLTKRQKLPQSMGIPDKLLVGALKAVN